MQENPPHGFYIDAQPQAGLGETLEALGRRKWTILIVLLLVVGAAVAYGLVRTPVYTAESTVLVSSTGVSAPGEEVEINLETERGLASSLVVANEVVAELGLDTDPATLAEDISVDAVTDTEFLVFSYSSPDPEEAQQVAEAFANAYLNVRREQVVESLLSSSETIQERIRENQRELDRINLELDAAAGATEASLEAQADSLVGQIAILEQQVATLTPPENFQVGLIVGPAQLPKVPSGPNLLSIIALAIIAGLGLGIGIALLRDRLDKRIRRIGDVELAIGAPVLVTVPSIRSWGKEAGLLESLRDIDAAETEAYRALRTSILHGATQRGLRALMVTSAVAGEGKTTAVANLAVALARAGKKVVLVSADLRRPRVHRIFPSKKPAGITTVLAEEHELFEALQPAEFNNLRVLHTGPVPGNPAELLGSMAMGRLLDELKDTADFVLIDAAPVIGVADAVSLAPHVDAVMLVIDARNTSINMLNQTVHTLDRVSAPIFGAVLNNVRDSRVGTYSTRYGYYASVKGDGAREATPLVRRR